MMVTNPGRDEEIDEDDVVIDDDDGGAIGIGFR
jgi:hypothetical protein